MSLFHAFILGLVEGLTEFLPISSTFHLIFTSHFLGLTQTDFTKFFEVFIQAGAILPIVLISLKEFRKNRHLFWLTVVGFIPAAVVGLVLHKIIKGVFFESPWLMVIMFMAVGILFLVLEWLIQQKKLQLNKKLEQLAWPQALWIGVCQALAVIPGVSRSGSLIAGGMAFGLTREQAVRFSFLLAVPTILAASALDTWQTRSILTTLSVNDWQALALGFSVAFVSAWASIEWLLRFVKTHTLTSFGWYRLGLGAIIVAWLLMA
jgi:undecaprenyl-diphosphatase